MRMKHLFRVVPGGQQRFNRRLSPFGLLAAAVALFVVLFVGAVLRTGGDWGGKSRSNVVIKWDDRLIKPAVLGEEDHVIEERETTTEDVGDGLSQEMQLQRLAHGCQNCHETRPDMLNIHLVPHSHDDVGWLKTVEQYFVGDNDRATGGYWGCVKCTIDTVVEELEKDPTRRYIQVETAFFWMWWKEQAKSKKDSVTQLVEEGRLEFVSGGWSMNDEAAAHYTGIVDNMAVGFEELQRHFGHPCGAPRIAWQIDPFGHSREQAALFAQMGFNAWFFPRIDHQEKTRRKQAGTMQFVWEADDSLGESSSLFTEILPDHYYPPTGFNFDGREIPGTSQLMTGKDDKEIRRKVLDFAVKMKGEMIGMTNRKHHIITMGGDFHYANATRNFENMDLLIAHSNALSNETGLHLLYSTPSCFVRSIHEDEAPAEPADSETGSSNGTFHTMTTGDFFPYASSSSKMWTGYFSSRPAYKLHVRSANALLHSAKQIAVREFKTKSDELEESITVLRRALGVAQHHDAITGTAKQHVDSNYHLLLSDGEHRVQASLGQTLFGNASMINFNCPLLNVSQCHFSEQESTFSVLLYNPLSRKSSFDVRLPLGEAADVNGVSVVDSRTGDEMRAALYGTDPSVERIWERTSKSQVEVIFTAEDVPALGYKTFHVDKNPSSEPRTPLTEWKETTIKEMESTLPHGLRVGIKQYIGTKSGAYIFHPSSAAEDLSVFAVTKADFGDFTEFHLTFEVDWVDLVLRVYDEGEVEAEWVVGPIPIKDHKAREIVVEFSSAELDNGPVFHTDSNGRQFMRRVRRPSEHSTPHKISGDYYPVTAGIYVEDETKDLVMGVVNDRSQGGSSLESGKIELMVHRRLLYDDGLGVSEKLDETTFKAEHGLEDVMRWLRLKMQSSHFHPTPLFHPGKVDLPDLTGLTQDLPENVHILSLEPTDVTNQVLLRLEHPFGPREHPDLSRESEVDLAAMFGSFDVVAVEEVTLGGNIPLSKLVRLHWDTSSWNSDSGHEKTHSMANTMDSTLVTLKPLQIRTFLLDIL